MRMVEHGNHTDVPMRNAQCNGGRNTHDRRYAEEMPYDTLDDVEDDCLRDMGTFQRMVLDPLKSNLVGVSFGGASALANVAGGYWGRAMGLVTGEQLQVRITPRGVAGMAQVPKDVDTICLAFRRTLHATVAHTHCVILFVPQEFCGVSGKNLPSNESYSAGCRGLHLVLPSDFRVHDAQRNALASEAQNDREGFHSIRPYTININDVMATKCGGNKHNINLNMHIQHRVTPGNSYYVVAGAMVGADVPDPLVMSVLEMTDFDLQRHVTNIHRCLTHKVPERHAAKFVTAGLTVLDVLTAEGIAGMLSNKFFSGALSDMLHCPFGIVLVIVMAIRIAAFPDLFGLGNISNQDKFANLEVRAIFESRWGPVIKSGGFRAIDCAIKYGHDQATARCKHSTESIECMFANMKFWQRVGQRIALKIVSDPMDGGPTQREQRLHTACGRADLVADDVTAARYAVLAKQGVARPVKDTPVHRIQLASRAEITTTFYKMFDSVEQWLRTGTYGEMQISPANVNIASNRDAAASCSHNIVGDSSDEECCDDVLDNRLNKAAMESASGAINMAILQGGAVAHILNVSSFVVGPKTTNKCADCDADVHVLDAVGLNTRMGQCNICSRYRCVRCQIRALRTRVLSPDAIGLHCERCVPSEQKKAKKGGDKTSPAKSHGVGNGKRK